MKKKIFFGVYKLKGIIINTIIVLLLAIISTVAFVGGNPNAIATNVFNGAYYNGEINSKNVSLMVNVYWGEEYIDDMLEIFKENDVKTTFFLGGMWVLEHEDLVKKIVENGHEIANHGYKHKSQDSISEKEAKTEIQTTHNLIKKMTNLDMNLFAPPSGAVNKQTIEVATGLNYRVIMWTRDTIDWRDQNADLIYKRATKNMKGGDLILMHPTKSTIEALPKIISHAKTNGFNLTTVTETLGGL